MNAHLIELVRELPPAQQQTVEALILKLHRKTKANAPLFLRQDWAGALKEFNREFTSLTLQKKALEWRVGLD